MPLAQPNSAAQAVLGNFAPRKDFHTMNKQKHSIDLPAQGWYYQD
jgi:hypothetical protein